MSDIRRNYLLTGAALIALAGPVAAKAAEPVPEECTKSDASCDVLYVTAQKREQTLLDIPQSVSVVGGDALERLDATSFDEFLALVPGLNLVQSTPGEGRLILRGINTGGIASSVAVYLDETPFGSSSGLVNGAVLAGDFDTFDVERIEVLRGPQGTLYGANSLGGVLKYVTAKPSTEAFSAKVRGGVESVDGGETGYSGAGVVNVPVSDKLAVRASGFYREVPGFIDSVGDNGSDIAEDINGTVSSGGRLSALYQPTDTFSIRLSALTQTLDTDDANEVDVDAETLELIGDGPQYSRFAAAGREIDYELYNGTVEWDLGAASLTSSTSYGTLEQALHNDIFSYAYGGLVSAILMTPPVDIVIDQNTDNEKFTQEVRLAGSNGFDWLVGGYYTEEEGSHAQTVTAVLDGTVEDAGIPTLIDVLLESEYKEMAAFANTTFYLGDRFDLTVGGRYSHNEQSADQVTDGLPGLFVAGLEELPTAESDENVFTYSIAPRYELSDQVTAYARIAKGYRPGGPNALPPAAPPETPRTYSSDTSVNYEAGIKAELGDFSFDAALFHIDWEDIQLVALVGDFGVNTNGGSAQSTGAEFSANWTPVDGLSLSANGAYTDTELTEDTDQLAVGGDDGDNLPYVPELTLSLVGDYQWTLFDNVPAFIGGAFRYQSEMGASYISEPVEAALGITRRELPAYETLDLRAGLLFDDFTVELFARNVTNEEGLTSGGNPSTNGPPGVSSAGIIRPRTIGLNLTAEF